MLNRLFFWRERYDLADLMGLEAELEGVFVPVMPDPGYIRDLKSRLRLAGGEQVSISRKTTIHPGIWIAGSLLSGAIVLILGARGIIALLAVLGIMHPASKRINSQECAAPVQQIA
jgi:hypothetical protein